MGSRGRVSRGRVWIAGVAALIVVALLARARMQANAERAARCDELLDKIGAAVRSDSLALAGMLLSKARDECGSEQQGKVDALAREFGQATTRALVPSAPAPAPVPSMPASVPKGTWARVPMPGKDIPNTPANRIAYTKNALAAVPGEPAVNKAAATKLLAKLRAKLAEQASIPLQSIKMNVGDSAVSLVVSDGTMAHLSVRGEPRAFPVCSEGLLGTSMLSAETTHDEFSKAGVRGILCTSDGCTAVMDMRPTTSGGGIYGGDACLSMADMMKLAIEEAAGR